MSYLGRSYVNQENTFQNNLELLKKNEDDIIYYNVTINNNTSKPIPAEYNESRTRAIIATPSDYYMSVVRFSFNASLLPILICPAISPGGFFNQNVNTTPYSVTLSYVDITDSSLTVTVNLAYIPENDLYYDNGTSVTAPTAAVSPAVPSADNIQDNSTSYYYIYYYSTIVKMVNVALQSAFEQIVLHFPTLEPNVSAPYIIFDRPSGKFSLIVQNVANPDNTAVNVYTTPRFPGGTGLSGNLSNVPVTESDSQGNQYYYDSSLTKQPRLALLTQKIQIFMNDSLYELFDSIESFKYNVPSSVSANIGNQQHNLLVIDDLKNNYYYPPQNTSQNSASKVLTALSNTTPPGTTTAQPVFFQIEQQYSSISNWNSLTSVLITTSTLPIIMEGITGRVNSGDQSLPIITDFIPYNINPGDNRTQILYNPTGPYRMINMISNQPLNRINIKLFWQDKNGQLYPFMIPPSAYGKTGFSNTMKLLFIRKELMKYTLLQN